MRLPIVPLESSEPCVCSWGDFQPHVINMVWVSEPMRYGGSMFKRYCLKKWFDCNVDVSENEWESVLGVKKDIY